MSCNLQIMYLSGYLPIYRLYFFKKRYVTIDLFVCLGKKYTSILGNKRMKRCTERNQDERPFESTEKDKEKEREGGRSLRKRQTGGQRDRTCLPIPDGFRLGCEPSPSTARHILKRTENKSPHRNLYTSIQSSINHNTRNVEITQTPSDWPTDNQHVAHPQSGILFSYKKGWNIDTSCPDGWTLKRFC